jgi:hypothetical protein
MYQGKNTMSRSIPVVELKSRCGTGATTPVPQYATPIASSCPCAAGNHSPLKIPTSLPASRDCPMGRRFFSLDFSHLTSTQVYTYQPSLAVLQLFAYRVIHVRRSHVSGKPNCRPIRRCYPSLPRLRASRRDDQVC